MRIAFRTDASLAMGTGHLMRCLTLADLLTARGASCEFVSRRHEGNLIEGVRSRGYVVHALELGQLEHGAGEYARWLGTSQAEDLVATQRVLGSAVDWLVVDHYGLDAAWESGMRRFASRLFVMDDLAVRRHDCEVLLDSTFGRQAADYRQLVPGSCRILCGSQFALLRPEFADARASSLENRLSCTAISRILVTMGGTDPDDVTSLVLDALDCSMLPVDTQVTVVMGANAPHWPQVEARAARARHSTRVLKSVSNMATLMASSDLAIGASGATAWERCCLGLPTIALVLAENQRFAARQLANLGATRVIERVADARAQLPELLKVLGSDVTVLHDMSKAALQVTDGAGASRVVEAFFPRREPQGEGQ